MMNKEEYRLMQIAKCFNMKGMEITTCDCASSNICQSLRLVFDLGYQRGRNYERVIHGQ